MKAQLTQSVIRCVISKYKAVQTVLENETYRIRSNGKTFAFKKNLNWLQHPIRFLSPQADLVRGRDFSFLNDGILSVATMKGRAKVKFAVRKESRIFDKTWKIGGAKLLRKGDDWFLHISVTKQYPDVTVSDISDVVGMDRGLVNLVTERDKNKTSYHPGKEIAKTRAKFDRLRASMQKKGTKGAKRVLKRISGRENRWMENVNHTLSKTLVEKYHEHTLFAIEDLSGISFDPENLSSRNADGRHALRNWSFYSFEKKLQYKAMMSGNMLVKFDPQYSSQRCPACGHICKDSRNHGRHEYVCVRCGTKFNDDEVAGYNLRTLGLLYLAGENDPHFSK